ncbi:MAG: DUF4097 family beta strand repeat-containing protein [Hyphomicrobiales bacterium]
MPAATTLTALLLVALALAPAPGRASDSCADIDVAKTFGFDYHSGRHRDWVTAEATPEARVASPRGTWRVDGAANGAISVSAWDRGGVLVCAKVVAAGADQDAANALLRQVRIVADERGLRVEGPEQRGDRRWAIAVHVFAPNRLDLAIETANGPITVVGMRGRTDVRSDNGPISVSDVGGRITGGTTNGPIELRLTGTRWQGDGVDLHTTNGPVTIAVPRGYSADLDAGTMNGPFDIAFPVTVQGRLRHSVRTSLGSGGSLIRVRSVNGPVTIQRDGD